MQNLNVDTTSLKMEVTRFLRILPKIKDDLAELKGIFNRFIEVYPNSAI